MVVLTGFFQTSTPDSLNNSDGTVALGVIDFDVLSAQSIPNLTFLGTKLLSGFEDGPFLLVGDEEPTSGSSAGLVSGGSESTDNDKDGRGDNVDNCTNWWNPDQHDTGGVRLVGVADGTGTACQCGDSGGDGAVDDGTLTEESTPEDDVTKCQEALAQANGPAPPGETPEEKDAREADEARCAVTGAESSTPTIVDIVVMEKELEAPGSAGTSIEQACLQAVEGE
jgi:hypothetical protein